MSTKPEICPFAAAAGLVSERPPMSGARRSSSSRPAWVVCLLLALWILNGFDLTMTLVAHRQGVLEEVNPAVAFILSGGTAAVVLFKMSLVCIGSAFLYRCRHSELALTAVIFLVVVYGFLAVYWNHCYGWYEISLTSGFAGSADPLL